eukprot:GAHX01000072.1.p1 GENE.GAHX01000072.1~~GAHX01000072.1.p1  ORF type:complete len:181 (-),score=47.35 GAHX01000072.1:267-809(-)
MGERKNINQYYDPNFDPNNISDTIKKSNTQTPWIRTRTMLPLSVKCSKCLRFTKFGKKINAQKQTIRGKSYLGVPILRFAFNCYHCGNKMAYKTDPKNGDYEIDYGATKTGNLTKIKDTNYFETEIAKFERDINEQQTDKVELIKKSKDAKNKEFKEFKELIKISKETEQKNKFIEDLLK